MRIWKRQRPSRDGDKVVGRLPPRSRRCIPAKGLCFVHIGAADNANLLEATWKYIRPAKLGVGLQVELSPLRALEREMVDQDHLQTIALSRQQPLHPQLAFDGRDVLNG